MPDKATTKNVAADHELIQAMASAVAGPGGKDQSPLKVELAAATGSDYCRMLIPGVSRAVAWLSPRDKHGFVRVDHVHSAATIPAALQDSGNPALIKLTKSNKAAVGKFLRQVAVDLMKARDAEAQAKADSTKAAKEDAKAAAKHANKAATDKADKAVPARPRVRRQRLTVSAA